MMEGELVDFIPIDRLPPGAKKVAEVPESHHIFYRKKGQLFMRSCVGDVLEVEDPEDYGYRAISEDFENLPDPWGERERVCRRRRRK